MIVKRVLFNKSIRRIKFDQIMIPLIYRNRDRKINISKLESYVTPCTSKNTSPKPLRSKFMRNLYFHK